MTDTKVSVFGGAVALKNSEALTKALEQSASDDPRGNVDGDYLNFSGKSGRYVIGKEQRAIGDEELWVANIAGFESGWVCWKGAKPVATRMASIQGTPVSAPDTTEHSPFGEGEGWFQAKAMSVKSLDNMQQGYLRVNSISGVSAISELQKMIAQRRIAGEASWPVFSFTSEVFKAQSYSNYKPVFEIAGWLSDEVVEAAFEPGVDLKALIEKSSGLDDDEEELAAPAPTQVRRRV